LTVVVCGCRTWSLTLREEHTLRVLENTVLRKIYGPKGKEVAGDWRKLHIKELHVLYSSPNFIRLIKSRSMKWTEHVAWIGEKRNASGFWWGKLKQRDNLKK
jgi:hypothetical protein